MKKIIVCDLDGTLAPSKSSLERSMAQKICLLLEKYKFAVISGGAYEQFQRQFLNHLYCDDIRLNNLYLFPTNGSSCFVYNENKANFKNLYEENLTEDEKTKIFASFENAINKSGVDLSHPFGKIIEDRGGQVTFSGKGQEAPLQIKEMWDQKREKRQKIVNFLKKDLPEFEIRIGGATSIDITRKGITKAYAIQKIEKMLDLSKEDIVFVGDALFDGGNDSSAKETGVECISVSGPAETEVVFDKFLKI